MNTKYSKKRKIQTNTSTSARSKGGSSSKLYSNAMYKKKVKADQKARREAEDLAKLPKNPVLRFFAKLHPKRVFRYWFSTKGLFTFLKGVAICFCIGIIGIAGLFMYFKKDLDKLSPEQLEARVQNTVNTYLDRHGEVLWEDKGAGNYRLTVKSDEISTYMRQATIALEDRKFYDHMGVDFHALVRAFISTATGQQVQGGSTLTQQLIKQVYFAEEAHDRTMTGVPRKIKETILAIEVEKMYDKEQILTLYLNESPYGGRRNGVESGARTYFGKSAKDLNLAEAALLAAIPNNPWLFNPYNKTAGANAALIRRQHKALNDMAEVGYITKAQAEEAKEIDILATVLPEASQYADIKAPWFVLETQKQIEEQIGVGVLRSGGFTIKTTLDYRVQKLAEEAVAKGRNMIESRRLAANNIAMSSIDNETGQVLAVVGSMGWEIEGYGQVNATTSMLPPGSTIKPLVSYAPLMMPREGQNFTPATMIRDDNINNIYCRGNTSGKCGLKNYSGPPSGNNYTIRQSLASSLNIAAVKGVHINGVANSVETARAMGVHSLCTQGFMGLPVGIGSGCEVKLVEQANAYATLARSGVYKPLSYWLEIKNSNGDIIDQWTNTKGTQAIHEEVAYMITDILADTNARRVGFGNLATQRGLEVPGVETAPKTGTTENGRGEYNNNWICDYSTVVSTCVWTGRHDGGGWRGDTATGVPKEVLAAYSERVHPDVFRADGRWKSGDWFVRPAGIKTLNGDIVPSWYDQKKNSGVERFMMTFDTITMKLATDCTPEETRIEIEVTRMIDPVTKREIWNTQGYDRENVDDLHQCNEARPAISGAEIAGRVFTATFKSGRHQLTTYEIIIAGAVVASGDANASRAVTYTLNGTETGDVQIVVRDAGGYTAGRSVTIPAWPTAPTTPGGNNPSGGNSSTTPQTTP